MIISYSSIEFQSNYDQNLINDDFSDDSSETSGDFLVDQGTNLSFKINLNAMDKFSRR